jgi:predicted ATP-grasp superfamily ATP-dependent carboligase
MWLSIRVIGMAGMLLIWLSVTGLIAVLLIRETHLRQTDCTAATKCRDLKSQRGVVSPRRVS